MSTGALKMVDPRCAGTDSASIDHEGLNVPPAKMTISEAKDFFARFRGDLRPDVESLVGLFREAEVDAPLANSNFLHALSLTELMIDHTRQSFRMLTGCAGDGFLSCLRDSFHEMLSRVKKAKGTARIIFLNGSHAPTGCISELLRDFPETLRVVSATSSPKAPIAHFIVCDDDMVRDESLHEPLSDTSSANLIKARVFFKNRSKASAFAGRFDVLWNILGTPQSAR